MMSGIFSGKMQKTQIWCLKKILFPPPFLVGGSKERKGRINLFGPYGIQGSECVFRLAHFMGECLPGARPARYFSINYPDFSPSFTLPWRSPPSRPHCTAHLPYKARCKIKQYL